MQIQIVYLSPLCVRTNPIRWIPWTSFSQLQPKHCILLSASPFWAKGISCLHLSKPISLIVLPNGVKLPHQLRTQAFNRGYSLYTSRIGTLPLIEDFGRTRHTLVHCMSMVWLHFLFAKDHYCLKSNRPHSDECLKWIRMTRMHPSRMCTARSSSLLPWGVLASVHAGIPTPQVWAWRTAMHARIPPPSCEQNDWQTGVKT